VALGSPGRTKVYILDEVHMLTKEASAALLKTLEEPPDHVVFVLATTDPHKVLPTIRSRTQHYEFRLLSAEDLAEHVTWVIHDAGLDLPDDVVEYVVRQGAGSARDTLSALERVAAAGGVVDDGESLGDLLDAVAAADASAALVAVADAVASGRDPRVLGEALLARLRDVFLVRMDAPTAHLTGDELARVQAWADQLGDRATTRALEAVGDALLEMRQAPDPRIPLEVALVKLTRVEGDGAVAGLEARVAKLEAALAAGSLASAPKGSSTPTGPAPRSASSEIPSPAAPVPQPLEASTPGSGGGPAAQARAALAKQKADRATRTATAPRQADRAPTPAPSPSPAAPRTTTSAPPPPQPPAATDSPAPDSKPPAPAEAVAPDPVVETPAVAAPAPSGAGSSVPAGLWTDRVLPKLAGLTKAMFQSAELASVEGSVAVVTVENDHHKQNCERKRADVERVLSDELGQPITVRITVGGSGDPAPRGGAERPAAAVAPVSDDPDEHLAGADVHELDDAPDAPSGGLAALTEAFPGAELIEES